MKSSDTSESSFFLPSSLLPDAAQVLERMEQLRQIVGPLLRLCLILDTNFVLQDLWYVVKNLRQKHGEPALLEVLRSRVASVFAPTKLDKEVRSHFAEYADRLRVPVSVFEDLWAKYTPHIKFCSDAALPGSLDPATRRLERRDPTDASFPSTFAAVGADAILTKDPDYDVTGLPLADLGVVMDLRTFARHKTVELHFMIGGFFVSSVALAGVLGVVEIGRRIVGFVERLPSVLQLALGIGGVAFILSPGLREKALGWVRPYLPVIKEYLQFALDRMTEAGDAKALADAAEKKLVSAVPRKKRTLRQAVVAVLVEAEQPLGEDEIALRVMKSGYSTKSPSFRAYLRRVLLHDSRFKPVPAAPNAACSICA